VVAAFNALWKSVALVVAGILAALVLIALIAILFASFA